MGNYDRRSSSSTKGKVVSLRKNKTFETRDGDEYTAHLLIIETEDGDQEKFKVSTKSKAAEFVAKLKEGQDVTVKTGGKYNSVIAVYKNDFEEGGVSTRFSNGAGNSKFRKKAFDSTGAIQGMVLKAAIDIALASESEDKVSLETAIVDAAKVVLLAKEKVDKLVVQALKSKDDEEDNNDSDGSDEDEDTAPKKKKKLSKKDSEEDEADDEEIPF